ncbi:peptidoglycan-binding domain-containing protein [Streptomyces europaeiscabiei]|uniref:peptidoglycan-binding domain-containing protein n=1 Tax=Streptomyces europaeiscabiei TaxID=146819 RepID=UPI0029A9F99F|nr:peptidoglycan-binding protein [Streptomyces europaeiscabiei]MDX3839525.1 peptidoglycan-binding protein [Streptomyces europaeiscabiei]
MPLKSKLFRDDQALQKCLVSDANHVTPGAQGDHVTKIQAALVTLGAGVIGPDEVERNLYGPTTVRTVLAFKGPPRNILGPGQTTPDNIVGKKTIAALDNEIVAFENRPPPTVISLFVSLTHEGSPHDHNTCPVDTSGHKVDHMATPINPGLGRKVNIGGEGETQYQGFEDFVTDPGVVGGPPRPLTDTIASDTATDIALRSAPITTRGEREIRRIATSNARLTIATNTFTLPKMEQIVKRLGGVVIERISLPDTSVPDGLGYQVLVVVLPIKFFGTPSTPDGVGTPILSQGSQGEAVRKLQRLLNGHVPDLPSLAVDGDFGPATDARVQEYQRRVEITVDGVVGPQTWGMLSGGEQSEEAAAGTPTLQQGSHGPAVPKLQRLLNDHLPDLQLVVDGRFGPVTDGRVREFQQRVDIAVDGIVGPQTWGHLTQ